MSTNNEPVEIGSSDSSDSSGSSGSSGRDDGRDGRRRDRLPDIDEFERRDRGRERALEQQPEAARDVRERATERIAEQRAAREVQRQLGRRDLMRRANRRGAPQTVADRDPMDAAPVDVEAGTDVVAEDGEVSTTREFERDVLESELSRRGLEPGVDVAVTREDGAFSVDPIEQQPAPSREDIDANLEPDESWLSDRQQQIDFEQRRAFRIKSTAAPGFDDGGSVDLFAPAAELVDRVADLPGVDATVDRARTAAMLGASATESAADAVSPVTDPVVSVSRGAAEFASERVVEPAVENFNIRPSTLAAPERSVEPRESEADRVAAEGLEAAGQGVTDLTVGFPALAADVTRVGTDAAIFTGRTINEEGVVRGTETVLEEGGDVALEASRQAAESFREDPAVFAARTVGYAVSGYGVSRAASGLARRAVAVRDRVNVPNREQFLRDERGMAGGQRTVTIEEQQQRVGREIDEATPLRDVSEERARNRRRQAELELEREAPRGQTINDLFTSEKARARAIEQRAARNVLEERAPRGASLDSMIDDAQLRSQQIQQARRELFGEERGLDTRARPSQATAVEQTVAAAATAGSSAGLTTTGTLTADPDESADSSQEQTVAATAPDEEREPREAFETPAAAIEAVGATARPPEGTTREAMDTPATALEATGTAFEWGEELGAEQAIERGVTETTLAERWPGRTLTTFRRESGRTLRSALPDPESRESGFIPQPDEAAESWRTPILQAGEVLEELEELDDGGGR